MGRSLRFLPPLRYSLASLFVVTTCAACFFGGRASRNAEVVRLHKDLEPFLASTKRACGNAVVLHVDNGLCEISIGRDDGLWANASGAVMRGDTFVAQASVQRMSSDRCVARLDVRAGYAVQKGDRVEFDWGR
jgi:hypothetical protein